MLDRERNDSHATGQQHKIKEPRQSWTQHTFKQLNTKYAIAQGLQLYQLFSKARKNHEPRDVPAAAACCAPHASIQTRLDTQSASSKCTLFVVALNSTTAD